MPKRYTSRKRTVRKKSRKRITRFRRYRTGTRAKAKSYFRLKRAAKNYSRKKKFRIAKKQYKYTSGKGVKNKIRHLTMSEFALLPFYDLARLSAMVKSDKMPNMYTDCPADVIKTFHEKYLTYWYKYGAILPEKYFNASSPFVIGSNKDFPPYLYAFNPILSPVTCGNKMQLYAAIYQKFKYVGIKVTWHPRARTVTTVIPTKSLTTPAKKEGEMEADDKIYDEYHHFISRNARDIPVPPINEACTGFVLDDESFKRENVTTEWSPASTPTMYMHVYFGKQIDVIEAWDFPHLTKEWSQDPVTKEPKNTYKVQHVIYNYGNARRMRAAPFYEYNSMLPCIEKDSKLHKVYDMTKPFSFFVRPMVATNAVSKEAPPTGAELAKNFITELPEAHEVMQKGLKHLGYQDFNHSLTPTVVDIPQDNYATDHLKDNKDIFYNRWDLLSNDDNFFNPIMFWYCFTTSENYTPDMEKMTDDKDPHQLFPTTIYNEDAAGLNTNAKRELSAHPATNSDFLNGYGYFDVTFYTKWKQERPLVSNAGYIGIIPSDTGVKGMTTPITSN